MSSSAEENEKVDAVRWISPSGLHFYWKKSNKKHKEMRIDMKNQKFIEKAFQNFPALIETKVKPVRTVELSKNESKINITETEMYSEKELKKGSRICLDFGDHQVGYLSLKLGYTGSHPDAPVWMRIHFAENPVELFENAKDYNGWICSSWIEEEQIHIDIVPSEINLPRRYAFRYVQIEILDISSKFNLVIEDASCTAVSSAEDEKLLGFKAQNEYQERLDKIACRTLHNCMQTVFEDGPKRDRRLWMGDLRMQALANYETYRKDEMVKSCLYLFAGLPMEDGKIGACLFLEPEPEVDDTQMFDYSLFFVNTLWDYYAKTNDRETLEELWPTAYRQIEIAKESLDEGYLVKDSDVLGWCFVDWNLNLNKQASAQGILLYALSASIRISQVLGEVLAEEKLAELYCECRNAANDRLWDREKQCYVSGKDRQVSIASQVWMVLGEAVEEAAAKNLMNRAEELEGAEGMVTPYMYHNYIDALIHVGEKHVALEKLEAYWGGMAELGADTFWELYNPENAQESPYGGTIVNSYCHAWSCAPAYFLRKYFKKEETLWQK